eukprot:gene9114-10689_t
MTTPDLSDPAIMQHIKAVQDGTERWMVLGYVPKSNNKIKFYDSGNGGLDEMREELSDSSIRFGYIRYQINNMDKYVYIAFCGDGVNGPIKGSFSGHAIEIGRILKPMHHQLNARNEDDLDEKAIIAALTKATGASYDSGAKNQGTSRASVAIPTSVAAGRVAATQSSITSKTFDKSDYNKKDESSEYWKKTNQAAATQSEAKKPARPEYNITNERDEYWKQQNQQTQAPAPAPKTTFGGAPSGPAPTRTVASRFQQATTQPEEPAKPPPPRAAPGKFAPPKPVAFQAPAYEEPAHEEPAYEEQAYEEPAQEYEQQYEEPAQEYEQQYEEPAQEYEQQYEEPAQEYEQQYEEPAQEYEQQYEEPAQEYEQQYEEPAAAGIQVQALYAYAGENEGDLSFNEGDIINVLDQSDPDGWWQGEVHGVTGGFSI